jgi:hypothetical protein
MPHANADQRVLGFLSFDLSDEFFDALPEEELRAWECSDGG